MSHMWVRAAVIISSVTAITPAWGQEFAAGDSARAPISLLDRQAKLSVEDVPLQAALDELARQSAAPVAFSPSQLPDRTVSCDCVSASVAKALDQILEGTAATYREMSGQIVISRSPAPAAPMPRELLAPPPAIRLANAISQTPLSLRDAPRAFPRVASVTGVVREASTREAVRGARITVANGQLQAVTDDRGAYTLANVPAGSVLLRVQGIGFAPMERTITVQDGEALKQDFDLTRRAFELDAIVVTGTAGGTLTRAIGNVVSTVDAAQVLAATPAPNVEQLLSARTPGVTVLPATGQVGTGAPIRIRGTNSMALVNEPIVFIDGVRIDSDPRQGPSQLTTSRVSRLSDLNPDDIQSIEIIKGPSAATLYGTEASNGVVQIITKRGAAGRPQIDFTIRRGTNWLENPEGRAGLRWWRDTNGQLQSINLYRQERLFGTGPIFTNGALQSYSANLSGGNPNMRYFASTSYDHDVGVVPWNWDKRISTRLNLDMSVSDKISARMNTMYVDRKISLAQTNYNTDPFSNLVWGNPRTLNTPVRGFFRTPPEEWDEVESRADNSRITLGLELKHSPFKWFTHRVSTGLDRNDGDNVVLHPRQPEGAAHFWGQQGLGQKVVDHAARRMVTFDYSSSATFRPLSSMEFTTSGGFQYYQRQTSTITANGREFPAIPLTTVTAGGIKTSAETFEENATVGVYLQQQMAWRNRVFLTGAVRGDDNSAFGAQYDAAIYPKLSGTWVMNEESFWPLPWVNQFKLRAAWGAAGQQPGTFDAAQLYDPEVSGNDQAVLIPGSYGNPALSPERSDELEYGFDATLLNGRIELNVTRYQRHITDAIVNRPVPPSTGFTQPPANQIVNLGKVSGSGNELGINARLLEGQKFGVDVGFQISTNHNRIDDLGGLDVIGAGGRQEHRPGFPVGAIFIKDIISAEVSPAGVLGRSFCDGGTGPTGLERGGPVVDCAVAPRVYWSPSMPTWQFGFNTTFTVLRNLRLYARIEGNGGHHTINTELRASHNLGITEAVLRADDPLMLATRRDENDVMGLYDGSFAKLREVALTYTMSPRWLSIVRASRGSISVSARNLMMLWTGAHGFGTPRDGRVRQVRGLGGEWTWDPEIRNPSQIQSDYTVYMPPTTSATVTVRLGF